ncbi:hypothetical protein MMC10_000888 [Thelotrema lepadinum]|nr:hypothetical protein [Thelotrema lepadinum]
MDPLSITTGVAALLQGSITVVKYIQDVKDGGKERDRLSQEVSRLVRILEQLQDELDKAQEDDPWFESFQQILAEPDGALGRVKILVNDLDAQLRPENRLRRFGHKLAWPLSKSRVKEILDSIQRYCAEIEHFLSRGHRELSKTIHSDVKALREKDARENSDAITSWLSTLEFGTRQTRLFSGAIAAGQWLFDSPEFKDWISGQTRVLMCHGAPGAGKTVLSSLAIDYLQHNLQKSETPVLFLYLSHKEGREQTLPNLLGSLLKQLIQRKGQVPAKIASLYDEEKRKESRLPTEKMLDLLKQQLGTYSKTYIVVDALDESDEDTRKSLIDYLIGIESSRTSFMWTARSLGDTVGFRHVYCNLCGFLCGQCDPTDSAQCLDCKEHSKRCEEDDFKPSPEHASAKIQIVAQNDDIRKYIDRQIQESSRLHQVCQKDRNLKDKIIETIINSTQGIFLIARLQIDFLKRQLPTPKKMLAALNNLPTTPTELYGEAMTKIRHQSAQDVDVAMRFLSWVAFARRPLSFNEVQHAMSVTEGDVDLEEAELLDEDFLIPLTAGLITMDSEGTSVRLIHYTLYEYLYERREELFPDSTSNIAITVLTYLHFESFSEPCRGDKEDEEFETRLQKYPLLSYASLYWGEHASECYQYDKDIKSAVMALVRNPLKLASSIQAAWYTSHHWDVRHGVSSLHVCAWFGLDEIIPDLLEQGVTVDSPDLTYGQTPLMYACKTGRLSTAKTLLDLGADINHESGRGSTALTEALQAGEVEIAKYLVTLPSLNINTKVSSLWDRTILMLGVGYDYVEFVRLALDRSDISVNAQDASGDTALQIAIGANSRELVQLILDHKDTDINLADQSKNSPLLTAAAWGFTDIVELLLERGADTSIEDELGGTAMLRASDEGNTAVVEIMLKHSVEFRNIDKLGRTILHGACANGNSDIARLLVNAGHDINPSGDRGETPLHDAGREGYVTLTETLLELGADPLIKDHSGRTARLVAAQKGHKDVARILGEKEHQLGHEEGEVDESTLPAWSVVEINRSDLLESLISRGGDLNERDPDTSDTALHFATASDNTDILEQLLTAGANPDITNRFGKTPLKLAALNGNLKVTKLLLKHSAKVDIDDEAESALTFAQAYQNFEVAVMLIKAGARINGNITPFQATFFTAVMLGDAEVVKILIEHGVETQIRDPEGHTALQLAKLHDRTEVMQVLRELKSAGLSSRRPSEGSINTDILTAATNSSLSIMTKDAYQAKPSSDWSLSKNKRKKVFASNRRGF